MDLYFDNYTDLKAAIDALAKEKNVKRVGYANGDEHVEFWDGTVIRFRGDRERRCRCPQGCC